MPDRPVIEFAVGVAASIVAAPFVAIGLRYLFALFLTEATDLFTLLKLKRQDALVVGGLLARLNVVVALLIAGPGQRTLPRQMFAGINDNISLTITAAATLLIAVSLVLMMVVGALRRRGERMRRAVGQRDDRP